jgi:hypothetical protein
MKLKKFCNAAASENRAGEVNPTVEYGGCYEEFGQGRPYFP